jgi:hypothetical protein
MLKFTCPGGTGQVLPPPPTHPHVHTHTDTHTQIRTHTHAQALCTRLACTTLVKT